MSATNNNSENEEEKEQSFTADEPVVDNTSSEVLLGTEESRVADDAENKVESSQSDVEVADDPVEDTSVDKSISESTVAPCPLETPCENEQDKPIEPAENIKETSGDESYKENRNIVQEDKFSTSSKDIGEKRDEVPGASASCVESKDNDYEECQSVYNVKWIEYNNISLPIITQNENGPCPLLAIMNYLLLQQKISFPPSTELVTSSNLISYLADYIFEHVPKHINADTRLNFEQKMHDAIAMFPKLQTGLDVNVRFTGVSHFEYTPSSEVFDLLDIPLYHSWLVDPATSDVCAAVGNATYNQLVEKIINQKLSSNVQQVEEALLAEDFLQTTASQMTYHGLCELSIAFQDSQMGILFRNNHFHTLLKHDGGLYVLATDHGFLQEPGVVWETLLNIEGDSQFVDANFKIFQPSNVANKSPVEAASYASTSDQIHQDYMVALSLQKEQSECSDQVSSWAALGLSDHELAKKLQEEENKLAEAAASKSTAKQQTAGSQQSRQRVSTSSTTSVNKDKKDSSCTVM